jgi:hypothetical protein
MSVQVQSSITNRNQYLTLKLSMFFNFKIKSTSLFEEHALLFKITFS